MVTAGTGSRVGIYCDLGPQIGAGHAIRCTALAQGLARRGLTPVLVGDFAQVPWVAQQAHGLELLEAPNVAEFVAQARAREWSGVVVDSYVATTEHWHDIRSLEVPALAIDDEAKRDLPVDLVVNQNLAAADYDYAARTPAPVLRGPNYALIRTSIAEARPAAYDERAASDGPLRVLVVLGGTDSTGGSVSLAERLLGSGQPVHLRVVTGDADSLHRLSAVATPAGSRVDGLAPRPDVEQLMAWADLAVSAAGSTVWELCCLGVPMALVTVAPNQEDNYRHLVAANVALGLGPLAHVQQSSESLAWILDRARADEVGRAGWQTVDGHGADRVAAAFAALLPVGR